MPFSIYNLLEFKIYHSSSFVILRKFKCNMSFVCIIKFIYVSGLCLILICPACSFIRLVLGSVLYFCYFFCIVMSFTVFLCCLIYRGDDFPFQKIAFSVWENSEFRFKGLSKWKFCLAIDTVHKNSVYERNTNYESGYFQRVT